jgi:hypothetical protein
VFELTDLSDNKIDDHIGEERIVFLVCLAFLL